MISLGHDSFMKFTLFFLSVLVFSSNVSAKCPVAEPQYVGSRQCYNPQMFSHISSSKRAVMQQFAPIALYMQELTGYPASVIVSHLVKEKEWRTSTPGNAFFGIGCTGKGDTNFTVPNGLTLSVDTDGCGNWQKYASPQSSVIGYIYWLLYAESGYYNGIRRQVPSSFPPPADRDTIIAAIAKSGYCAAGCTCAIGKRTGTYDDCMKSIANNSCANDLDNMMLCDYNYPILNGLPPLHKNIQPSANAGSGSATLIRFSGEAATSTAPSVGK